MPTSGAAKSNGGLLRVRNNALGEAVADVYDNVGGDDADCCICCIECLSVACCEFCDPEPVPCEDQTPATYTVTFSGVTLCACTAGGTQSASTTGGTFSGTFVLPQVSGCNWKLTQTPATAAHFNYYFGSVDCSTAATPEAYFEIDLTRTSRSQFQLTVSLVSTAGAATKVARLFECVIIAPGEECEGTWEELNTVLACSTPETSGAAFVATYLGKGGSVTMTSGATPGTCCSYCTAPDLPCCTPECFTITFAAVELCACTAGTTQSACSTATVGGACATGTFSGTFIVTQSSCAWQYLESPGTSAHFSYYSTSTDCTTGATNDTSFTIDFIKTSLTTWTISVTMLDTGGTKRAAIFCGTITVDSADCRPPTGEWVVTNSITNCTTPQSGGSCGHLTDIAAFVGKNGTATIVACC